MDYRSAGTTIADPYRAGAELGDSLESLKPDTVLIFCTVHYMDAIPDLVAGIRDILGTDVLLCGGMGDGIYETSVVASHGVSALGIRSDGQTQWKAVHVRGVRADSLGVAQEAARRVCAELDAPVSLAFALADGLNADGTQLVEGLRRGINAPCFGGLTADDRSFSRSITFLGDEAYEDGLMLLATSGRVPVKMNAASGWTPIGDSGRVTRAEGAILYEIDHRPAELFLREQNGKTMGGMGLAVLPIAEYQSDDDRQFVLRSCSKFTESGAVTLFGRVSQGARVQVCHASMEEILGGVETALSGIKQDDFEPAATIAISCAGRRWLLARSGQEEVDRTLDKLGTLPLIGIPSYGEIGPFRSTDGTYSSTLFHNATFVVCVLGK
jgi:hypothetical protein